MFPPENAPTASFPYRIVEQVGTGSMGIVYKAVETELDRTVAIKVLRQSMLDEEPPQVQDELRRRFLQEARAAAALSHPGVTTVYRVGEEGGLPYMVMEWLSGRTLEEILEERPRFGVAVACRLAVAVLETLDAAHRGGVVHRDIKPSNLVLLDDGRLKVTDFGIALLRGRELVKTQAGVVLATPKFASPEQLRGVEVDGRADLFSTGILLYRLLTGHYPFQGSSFMELANAILQQEPTPVRELQPDVPAGLEAAIRRALRKDREKRFPTATKMAAELRPFGQQEKTGAGAGSGRRPAVRAPKVDDSTPTVRVGPVVRELPQEPRRAVVRVVTGWTGRELDRQPTSALIDRLIEKPLHAPPFAGGVQIDGSCLLFAGGMLLGAVDTATGESGDGVVASLPETSTPRLHPVPEGLSPELVVLLATVLQPPAYRQSHLDSSFINLPALAQKLHEEKFDGIFRLVRGEAFGLVFFVGGATVLAAYSEGWGDVPLDQSWQHWVSEVPVRASVEEKNARPLGDWYRRAFPDLAFDVQPVAEDTGSSGGSTSASSSSRILQLFGSSRSKQLETGRLALRVSPAGGSRGSSDGPVSYDQAPAYRFLSWMVEELPPFFVEREKIAPWRYLVEWVPLVRKAWLHCSLERPGERESDDFDLVTADADGKVLHLGQRLAKPTPESFRAFTERAIAAKTARKKTGDVGGVFLIAPSFPEPVLEAYRDTVHGGTGSWFDVEESFTGYAGFVRIGARRGFHLLLVEEEDGGSFKPLIAPP